MSILSWFRRRAKARRDRKARPEVDLFEQAAARLGPGDVAIDCGANVGKFTVAMARTGARVYAFEPNPAAYEALVEATRPYANVTPVQAAITAVPGPVKLYLHKWEKEDPVHWSTGSSIMKSKRNVRGDRYTEVEGVQLSRFIRELDVDRVQLLKIDIEGAEVAVLNQLLDEGLHETIDLAFVEVHDRQIRELAAPTRALRERLESLGADHFNLDWR
jgi:FkbM family methyltransferase